MYSTSRKYILSLLTGNLKANTFIKRFRWILTDQTRD